MIKPSELRAHLQRAEQLGYSPGDLVQDSGVTWRQIDSLEPLPYETISGLFDLLARRTPEGFALRCGAMSSVQDFGIASNAMASKHTLREAFQHWIRYSLIAGPPLITTLHEQGDQWWMRLTPRHHLTTRGLRFCVEASIAAIERVIEELTREAPNTTRIEWPFKVDALPAEYGNLRTSSFRFGAKEAVYWGRRQDLDRPIPTSDGDLADVLNCQCEKLLGRIIASRPLEDCMEEYMLACRGRIPLVEEMAGHLGLSRRSLQRALQERNLSYQGFVQHFRCEQAKALLGEQLTDVKNISFALGFQDVSSFRRAFREWTGQTVTAWVAAHCSSVRRHVPTGRWLGEGRPAGVPPAWTAVPASPR